MCIFITVTISKIFLLRPLCCSLLHLGHANLHLPSLVYHVIALTCKKQLALMLVKLFNGIRALIFDKMSFQISSMTYGCFHRHQTEVAKVAVKLSLPLSEAVLCYIIEDNKCLPKCTGWPNKNRTFLRYHIFAATTDIIIVQKSYVCLYHCLAGNSRIMWSTFQPFSTCKTLINALFSEVSTDMFTQMTSTMT